MAMNRRGFLGTLAAAAAGLVLDPERLLWVPGQKTIFLPSPVMADGAAELVGRGNTLITPEWVSRDIAAMWRNSMQHVKITNQRYFEVGWTA